MTATKDKNNSHRSATIAFLAPAAGVVTFITLLLFCFVFFSRDKFLMPIGLMVATATSCFVGLAVYRRSTSRLESLTDTKHERTQNASKAWVRGASIQLCLYFTLCLVMSMDIRIVPRKFNLFPWIGIHAAIGLSAVHSLLAVFRIHSELGNRLVHMFWSIVFFVVLYLCFLYQATWLADPHTVPEKLSWY